MVHALVLPKVHTSAHLDAVAEVLSEVARDAAPREVRLVASIESARALWDVGDIAGWHARDVPENLDVRLGALLVSVGTIRL